MKTHFQILVYLLFLAVVPHICSAAVLSTNWDSVSEETKKICVSVENLSPPPQDLPDAATKRELENGCDPLSLYYGLYEDVDYVKARQCALLGYPWGDLVLAMIYANGKGVQRNLDLATQYACFDGAPAEIEGRVKHLQKLKLSKDAQEDFDMCTHVTSGNMMGHCPAIMEGLKNKQRDKELVSLTSKWTQLQQKAFHKLQEARGTFSEERVGQEVDISGTARGAIMIQEQSDLKDQFMKMLQACDQCKIPDFTAEQFQEADKQLNTLYKKALINKYSFSGCISPSGIKTTQRTWIKYRDAWVAFGHEKCPNVSKESWKTVITNERINQLKDLVNM